MAAISWLFKMCVRKKAEILILVFWNTAQRYSPEVVTSVLDVQETLSKPQTGRSWW
jgi:hypothetical protein